MIMILELENSVHTYNELFPWLHGVNSTLSLQNSNRAILEKKIFFFAYFRDCRVNPLTKRISLVIQMEPGEIANYNTAQIGIPKVTLSLLVTFFSY